MDGQGNDETISDEVELEGSNSDSLLIVVAKRRVKWFGCDKFGEQLAAFEGTRWELFFVSIVTLYKRLGESYMFFGQLFITRELVLAQHMLDVQAGCRVSLLSNPHSPSSSVHLQNTTKDWELG